jgi:hypothetical protein
MISAEIRWAETAVASHFLPVHTGVVERLGINRGGYFGERTDICTVLDRTLAVASAQGWQQQTIDAGVGQTLCFLHRPVYGDGAECPRLYISTGIHGDEPAGPLALQHLIEHELLPPDIELWVCPCLNPSGCARISRENADGLDLNRDYKHLRSPEVRAHVQWLQQLPELDLTLLLHEDWEANGFYVYELNQSDVSGIAESMVHAVKAVCPIESGPLVDGRPMSDLGIIRPETDPLVRVEWPEAFWLLQNKTSLSYTLESPSDYPLANRVAALVQGVLAAIRTWRPELQIS